MMIPTSAMVAPAAAGAAGGGAGTIMGMTPQMFASIAGQLGAALSPEGSAAQKVGTLAAGMGNSKIKQLAIAEQEKKEEELYKAILQKMTPEQVGSVAASGAFKGFGDSSALTESLFK